MREGPRPCTPPLGCSSGRKPLGHPRPPLQGPRGLIGPHPRTQGAAPLRSHATWPCSKEPLEPSRAHSPKSHGRSHVRSPHGPLMPPTLLSGITLPTLLLSWGPRPAPDTGLHWSSGLPRRSTGCAEAHLAHSHHVWGIRSHDREVSGGQPWTRSPAPQAGMGLWSRPAATGTTRSSLPGAAPPTAPEPAACFCLGALGPALPHLGLSFLVGQILASHPRRRVGAASPRLGRTRADGVCVRAAVALLCEWGAGLTCGRSRRPGGIAAVHMSSRCWRAAATESRLSGRTLMPNPRH